GVLDAFRKIATVVKNLV
uniref:Uperin-3.2 n=1 Tax=Uperoleia inundata TaxID=104953 RepID=UPE32_UPEIN|nr:RecName: Full=Uperin-3.2 [Uperoleia inundata]